MKSLTEAQLCTIIEEAYWLGREDGAYIEQKLSTGNQISLQIAEKECLGEFLELRDKTIREV